MTVSIDQIDKQNYFQKKKIILKTYQSLLRLHQSRVTQNYKYGKNKLTYKYMPINCKLWEISTKYNVLSETENL